MSWLSSKVTWQMSAAERRWQLQSSWCLSLSLSLSQTQTHTLSFFLSLSFKLSCDSRFQRAFTACSCVFKVIALVWANQRNFFENATRKIRTKGVWRNGCQPLYFSVLRESLLSWDGDREMEWCLHSIRVHIVFLILSIHCKQNLKELFVILWLPWTLFILLKFEDEKVYWKVQLVFLFHTNINRLWKFLFSTSCFQGRLTNCGELG